MAIYDWRDFQREDLALRFPRRLDIVGVDEWSRLVARMRDLLAQAASVEGARQIGQEIDRFVQGLPARPAGDRLPPRVFVSHQRDDWEKAERVAWLATKAGFEYWLDVHDPLLDLMTGWEAPPPVKAALIAGIIEMGLLNCSHVVALQTGRSRQSRWVPYEFGRAKQRLPVSWQAASWFAKGLQPDPDGDYLSLACCAFDERSLIEWLRTQPHARSSVTWPKPYEPDSLDAPCADETT